MEPRIPADIADAFDALYKRLVAAQHAGQLLTLTPDEVETWDRYWIAQGYEKLPIDTSEEEEGRTQSRRE